MKKIMRRLSDDRGVAMITVLFVGAVLTVVSSAAGFMTIHEFRASGEDRKAAAALAYAEAGVDRMIYELRRGLIDWNQISFAGCDDKHPALIHEGNIGNGSFRAVLQVYDRGGSGSARFVPTACSNVNTDIRTGQHFFEITSTGQAPQAKRIVRQVIEVKPLGLPIGIYAESRIDASGGGQMTSISMITPGPITGRDKTSFAGDDPYYTLNHFYSNNDTRRIPAAAHAGGQITLTKGGGRAEHPPSVHCDANGTSGTAGQSLWDGSSGGGTVSNTCPNWPGTASVAAGAHPPRSTFTAEDLKKVKAAELSEQDYDMLKDAAKTSGFYCKPTSNNNLSCTKNGGAPFTIGQTITAADINGVNNKFIAFFDFPADGTNPFSSARTIAWKANVSPCSFDPTINRSVVLIVRNGSLRMEAVQGAGAATITGALLLPEGAFDSVGSVTVHGTIIAKEFRVSGNATFYLDECWIQNIPGPFIQAVPIHWSEVDR